jgi:hypothetical protein
VNGIIGEPGGVIAVGVATGDGEDTLPKQVDKLVANLASLPLVPQAGRQAGSEAEPLVDSLQENRATVGAAVRLVKPGNKRFVEEIREENSLCRDRIIQAKASCVAEVGVSNRFLPRGGFCVF